ncbi:MAG: restriction endonuclease subunit S [Acidobacteriota bacterium]
MSFTASLERIVAENQSGLLCAAEHWERVKLSEVADILNGYAFSSDYFDSSEGVPLLRIRDVGKTETDAFYRGEFEDKYLVEPGELVIGMDGDFRCARWTGPTAVLNQRVCKVSPLEEFMRCRYLAYVLQGYLDAIHAHTSSITVRHLSSRTVADIPLPLPSPKEQDRITASLDAHFTRVDAAVSALERVRASLKRYRASVLKTAYEGRLVQTEAELARREGRGYESTSVVLDRILAERRARWEAEELQKLKAKGKTPKDDRWKRRYKEPEGPDTTALPELPEGWVWANMGQLSRRIQYGHTASADDKPHGPRFLRITDIQDGKVDWDNVPGCAITEDEIDKYRLLAGDLVFVRTGATTGKSYLIREPPTAIFASYLIRVQLLPGGALPEYVFAFFQSHRYWEQIERGKRGIGQPNVNASVLSRLRIPVPPVKEQRRIVMELERRTSIMDQIDGTVTAGQARAARLRQVILKRAFEGRLVAQDPDDEPASILLDRIRARCVDGAGKHRSKQTSLPLES